jgi:hypothetical protein
MAILCELRRCWLIPQKGNQQTTAKNGSSKQASPKEH